MSSVMRCRNGLMGVSLIGGSPVLRLEVRNPSILKTERPAPSSSALQLVTAPSTPRSHLRAALSRESGFVHWHELRVRGAAAIPSVMGGTSAVLIRNSDWSLRAIDRTRGSAVAFTAATAAFGDAPEKLIRLRISAVSLR